MFGPMTQPGKPVYGLEHSNDGLITFPGGVDLRFEGLSSLRKITASFSFLETAKESLLVLLGFQVGQWRRIWRSPEPLQRL